MKTKRLLRICILVALNVLNTCSQNTNIAINNVSDDVNNKDSSTSVIISNDKGARIVTKDGESILSGPSVRIVNGKVVEDDDPSGRTTSPPATTTTAATTTSTTTATTTTTTTATTTAATTTTATTSTPLKTSRQDDGDSVKLVDPGLDARQEIASYNSFMDEIFKRMNAAIQSKRLDPMELKLQPSTSGSASSGRSHIFTDPSARASSNASTTTESILILSTPKPIQKPPPMFQPVLADDNESSLNETIANDMQKVSGWLFGMSSLKRSGDVSIIIHGSDRSIQCPFSLGPLELKVSRTLPGKRTKSAKARTDLMQGFMDLRIDRTSGQAEITRVAFDTEQPATGGGVDVKGSLKRAESNKETPYRLVLASKAAQSLKKVARLVVAKPIKSQEKKR